jgi:hypothetical protein
MVVTAPFSQEMANDFITFLKDDCKATSSIGDFSDMSNVGN